MSANKADMVVVAGKICKLMEGMSQKQKGAILHFVGDVISSEPDACGGVASSEDEAQADQAELAKL